MKNKNKIDRRNFLKTSTAAFSMIFCLSGNLREALAYSRAIGKPLLTQDDLNDLFAKAYSSKTLKSLIAEIVKSPPLWLQNNFAVTDLQLSAIKSISSSDWESIKNLLRQTAEKSDEIKVEIISEITSEDKTSVSSGFAFELCQGRARVSNSSNSSNASYSGRRGK